MKPTCLITLAAFFLSPTLSAERKKVPVPENIPYGLVGKSAEEVAVFAVASKQGSRVLMSWDDGKTWEQSFLATGLDEDGGWHGNFAVYGMAMGGGVIGVFSGWGAPGVYLGTADGENWSHLNKKGEEVQSLWDATAGQGVMLTSASMWSGMAVSTGDFSEWKQTKIKDTLDGGLTQHMICGYGDYDGGRFVVVGDFGHVYSSADLGKTWDHTRIAEKAEEKGQDAIAFGNGIFVCSYPEHAAVSADGGKTWKLHPHGIKNERFSWRGLSFVNGEFWLTTQGGKEARKSKDGVTWEDLPEGTPGGRFVQGESGTIINVERRGAHSIRRSTDGKTWETVFTAPEKNVTWDLSFAVTGRMKGR